MCISHIQLLAVFLAVYIVMALKLKRKTLSLNKYRLYEKLSGKQQQSIMLHNFVSCDDIVNR